MKSALIEGLRWSRRSWVTGKMRLLAKSLAAISPVPLPEVCRYRGWDSDAIDLVEPGFIEFAGDGTGQFGFIAVRGWLDCRWVERDDRTGVEFTWEGDDEGDQVSGRGWASPCR